MSPGSDGGKVNGRPKMGCGEAGSYGDLKKKTGEGKYDRDHIPSKAALIQRARNLCKKLKLPPLTEESIKAIVNAGEAIAIPKSAHQTVSPTYGGRNDSLIAIDAENPVKAAQRDTDAMKKELQEHGADKRCIEAYNKAAETIRNMTEDDYDNLILDAISSVN